MKRLYLFYLIVLRGGKLRLSGNISPIYYCKTEACKSALQAILTGQAKWEPVKLPELSQCSTEAGMLVGRQSLCDGPLWDIDLGLWQKPVSTSQ